MTHYKAKFTPKIALYEPDIPQNTAAIIRTCACLGAQLEIIDCTALSINMYTCALFRIACLSMPYDPDRSQISTISYRCRRVSDHNSSPFQ